MASPSQVCGTKNNTIVVASESLDNTNQDSATHRIPGSSTREAPRGLAGKWAITVAGPSQVFVAKNNPVVWWSAEHKVS